MKILLILGNISINDSNNDTLSEKLPSDYEPEEMQLELEAVEPMAEQQNHLEAQKENPGHLEPEEKQQSHLELPEPIAAEEAEVGLKVAVNSYIDNANNETSSDDEEDNAYFCFKSKKALLILRRSNTNMNLQEWEKSLESLDLLWMNCAVHARSKFGMSDKSSS